MKPCRPPLLSLLAARASSLLNMAEVSRATGIAHSTLRRYLSLLEALFIVQPLPAWSANLGKRLVKAPKVHLIDAGLSAHLRPGESCSTPANSPCPSKSICGPCRWACSGPGVVVAA